MKHIWVLACALGAAGVAHADSGGVSGVSSPVVTPGDLRFEARTSAFNGDALDGERAHRVQGGYSFTDFWRLSAILRAAQPDGEDIEARSLGFENVFEFTPSAEWPVQVGLLAEYKLGLNDASDEVEFKLLMQRRQGPLTARLNLNASRDVGDDASDEWEHVYAARAMWEINDRWDLGGEAFGEPEAGAHYIGPRAEIGFGHVGFSAAYLVGYDDAEAEGQLRLGLEFRP
ncbi:MAG: hypothetical protein AB7G05_02075 [Hyphomonadaceae bacterium]